MVEDNKAIKNISLSHKTKFTIDGDYNRVLELDTTDMNILVRLEEAYPKMEAKAREAAEQMAKLSEHDGEDTADSLKELTTTLKSIDANMREEIDYIFDSDVSAVCVPKGNMYDPYNGEFRFEHIIEVLTTLYADNLSVEFKKMQDKVKKHTTKYTSTSKRKR